MEGSEACEHVSGQQWLCLVESRTADCARLETRGQAAHATAKAMRAKEAAYLLKYLNAREAEGRGGHRQAAKRSS